MIQKILVVLIGLVMSVVTALTPSGGMFASTPEDVSLMSDASQQTLATVRTGSGEAFARVSVLWVEVDGVRVTDDAWGTGEIDEMRFKVGVKGVEGTALAVGDKIVELHPTDIITIRMFTGDYSYRGVGGALATIQLQGEVKATELSAGEVGDKLRTERDPLAALPSGKQSARKADAGPIAFVVLDTGKQVETVGLQSCGARLFTEEASVAAEARNAPGALAAKWVKIDGRAIRDPYAGDGVVDRIEFEPVPGRRGAVLAHNDAPAEVLPGERVIITDFVGSYTVQATASGEMRVLLDGYAGHVTTTSALPLPTSGGAGAPIVSFDFLPVTPRTIDSVQFADHSKDEDGVPLLWQWDFGDGATSILQNPTHTFTAPGVYDVKLNVTDNDMRSSELIRKITVVNTEPIPDFTFSPSRVSADTLVAFADRATDPDGAVQTWLWDFGDGQTSNARNPMHQYGSSGNKTVTLTVTDDRGATSSLSKVLHVLNTPPTADFTYAFDEEGTDILDPVLRFEGGSPASLVPVRFRDGSADRDGRVASWDWNFGDGARAAGSNVTHAFARPGAFTVSLTVTDNMGEQTTVSKQIVVRNRAPLADFIWIPDGAPVEAPVTFTSTSRDLDGVVLAARWDFGDGSAPSLGTTVVHSYNRSGTFEVTLTVTDSALATSTIKKSVTVANSAPRAGFLMTPNPAFRNTTVTFTDASSDAEGDSIVSRRWEFSDGFAATQPTLQRSYSSLGRHQVTLYVTDAAGREAWASQSLTIVNRAPIAAMSVWPPTPIANRPMYFNATGADTDGDGPLTYEWTFSDTQQVFTGQNIVRSLPEGTYTVRVKAVDVEGGRSAADVRSLSVTFAEPQARFEFTPEIGLEDREVSFFDRSSSGNGEIKAWSWVFSDGTSSTLQDPKHVFAAGGDYTVELTVTDVQNRVSEVARLPIWIDAKPEARFDVPAGPIELFKDIAFKDDSVEHDAGDSIREWFWDFGDGTTSTDRHPVHRFETPGMKTVTLTVTDRFGASNSTEKLISISNSAPFAAWHTDGLLRASNEIVFRSYPDSFDPNDPVDGPRGASLSTFEWSFGDRGATASTPNASYVYPRSGTYVVSLVVGDGELKSATTGQSTRMLKIAANHAVPVRVHATMPGDRVAQLDDPRYAIELIVGSGANARTYRAYTMDGTDAIVSVPAGSWSAGEPVIVRLRDSHFRPTPLSSFLTLSEESGISIEEVVNFFVPVPLAAEVFVSGGEEPGLLDEIFPRRANVNGEALYTSFFEDMNGTGRATFSDGYPVRDIAVKLQARYVPARVASPARDALGGPLAGMPPETIIGWCDIDETSTDPSGMFEWSMEGAAESCSIDGGFHPLGRWEFRAIATYAGATQGTSRPAVAYVDPTGGLLFSTTFALV